MFIYKCICLRQGSRSTVWFKMPATPDKNHDETVSCSSRSQMPPPPPPPLKTLSRRNSLRLSSTLNIPIPPSLRRSPYLSSSSSVFNRGLASPTLPSEEDEKWLQDTIPLHSRHHEQVARSENDLTRGAGVTSEQGVDDHHDGVQVVSITYSPPHRHTIAVPTPRFVPPSLVILDSNWSGLCSRSSRRRWSTPLCPPNSKQDIYHVEKLIR